MAAASQLSVDEFPVFILPLKVARALFAVRLKETDKSGTESNPITDAARFLSATVEPLPAAREPSSKRARVSLPCTTLDVKNRQRKTIEKKCIFTALEERHAGWRFCSEVLG
jgi:hypothetical protein